MGRGAELEKLAELFSFKGSFGRGTGGRRGAGLGRAGERGARGFAGLGLLIRHIGAHGENETASGT